MHKDRKLCIEQLYLNARIFDSTKTCCLLMCQANSYKTFWALLTKQN